MVKGISEKDTVKTTTTSSAFILVKASNKLDFMEIYKQLSSFPNMISCDAVKGDYDVVLSYSTESAEKTFSVYKQDFSKNEGISMSEFLPISIPAIDSEIIKLSPDKTTELYTKRDDKGSVQSYILLNADPEKINEIYLQLLKEDNILFCGFTSGTVNLLLLVSGKQFSDIDKMVTKKIMNMDGILKVKEYPIINIYDL